MTKFRTSIFCGSLLDILRFSGKISLVVSRKIKRLRHLTNQPWKKTRGNDGNAVIPARPDGPTLSCSDCGQTEIRRQP